MSSPLPRAGSSTPPSSPFSLFLGRGGLRAAEMLSIGSRSGEGEEDSVYSNYEEKKLYIHEEGVSNKGGYKGGTGNRNSAS